MSTKAAEISIAEADERLKELSLLCDMLAGGIERSRRDLRQLRAEAAATQSQPEKGHAPASELDAGMLG